ncbi:MAG TPA: amidohydrolase, partial [Pseudohaliea sp.]|nr:amidohydrolase [Pseudohaliea sp.]
MYRNRILSLALIAFAPAVAGADLAETLEAQALSAEPQVIEWRRHFHEHPELSNREFRTAEKVAGALRAMGLEVETGIAHTGVVAYLEGGRPGPLVALRADMDALPVTERVDLPFASKATGTYRGREVDVMHACGHDTHMAMLLGAARALTAVRDELPGSVMFIFQPAEEG